MFPVSTTWRCGSRLSFIKGPELISHLLQYFGCQSRVLNVIYIVFELCKCVWTRWICPLCKVSITENNYKQRKKRPGSHEMSPFLDVMRFTKSQFTASIKFIAKRYSPVLLKQKLLVWRVTSKQGCGRSDISYLRDYGVLANKMVVAFTVFKKVRGPERTPYRDSLCNQDGPLYQ